MGCNNAEGKRQVTVYPSLKTSLIFPNGVVLQPYEDICLFIGRKKGGKSYAAQYYTQKIPRLIVWDYNWEHKDKTVVHTIGELNGYWNRIPITTNPHIKRVAFQPFDKSSAAFENLCHWVITHARFCCFEVEEIYQVATSNNIERLPSFKTIIDSGRHETYQIGLFVTNRRIAYIPSGITGNADHIFAFRQQKPSDWDLLEDYMEKVAEFRERNEKYSYLYYNGNDGETYIMPPVNMSSTTNPATELSSR